MNRMPTHCLVLALLLPWPPPCARSRSPRSAEKVNKKLVKLFGAGGFRGLAVLRHRHPRLARRLHPDRQQPHPRHARTCASTCTTAARYHAKVVAIEPELDVALIKIERATRTSLTGYFDVPAAAKRPLGRAGRLGPGLHQPVPDRHARRADVACSAASSPAYTKLHGRRGIFEAPYQGDVYVLDAITNNPGAAGGASTTRKGELLGIIGKELQNEPDQHLDQLRHAGAGQGRVPPGTSKDRDASAWPSSSTRG